MPGKAIERAYYPVLLDIAGRRCLVIGGGEVAARKVEALLDCGGRVSVVAPQVSAAIAGLAAAGKIELRQRAYQPGDLEGAYLVIAASDAAEVNAAAHREAAERGILINVVDDPQRCTFVVPSVMRRGRVAIAISTSGASPALAAHLRRELEGVIGPEYEALADLLARLRPEVMRKIADPDVRKRAWEAILASDVLELLRRGDAAQAEEKAAQCIVSVSAPPKPPPPENHGRTR